MPHRAVLLEKIEPLSVRNTAQQLRQPLPHFQLIHFAAADTHHHLVRRAAERASVPVAVQGDVAAPQHLVLVDNSQAFAAIQVAGSQT